MTKFLANCEVEAHLFLAPGLPVLRHDHPAGTYSIFLRDLQVKRGNDTPLLSALIVFDAPSLQDAKEIGENHLRDFLDYLTAVTNLTFKFHRTLQIFNWEPGNGERECIYFVGSKYHDVPIPGLHQALLDTIATLQTHAVPPRLRRALKWFRNGVVAAAPDDQFFYFWLVIEILAQLTKDPAPIADRCPVCGGPLHCKTCDRTPIHRPYPKQAIEQLFAKHVKDDWKVAYGTTSEIRNRLAHGDAVADIEAALKVKLDDIVNRLGKLAWVAIINQFMPVLAGKQVQFAQTNIYVHTSMMAGVHMQVGFKPNFDNPDAKDFPKINLDIEFPDPTGAAVAKEPAAARQTKSSPPAK